MIRWQHVYDDATNMTLRICPHGMRHPDPDDMAYHLANPQPNDGAAVAGRHDCDGCCNT